MKNSSKDPDFGATGQFELTGICFADKQAEAAFATTLGMEHIKTLLLVGAGPAHLQVLAQLAANRRSDLDVTLITPWSYVTYRGMVPGFVAGHYPLADCQIDLQPLLREAGVRWINARCSGLDAQTHSIMLDYGGDGPGVGLQHTGVAISRPAMLTYDFLSIDTGSVMEKRKLDHAIPGASEHALLVRPTEQFVNRWSQVLNRARAQPGNPLYVTLVGNSAAGIELLLAMQQGLHAAGVTAKLRLIAGSTTLAPQCAKGVQKRLWAQLRKRQIDIDHGTCTRVTADAVQVDGGRTLPSNVTVVAAGASAPEWLNHSGLAQDANGCALVNTHLQSTSHKNVFATGEVATRLDRPRAQNNAYARRDGTDLALNLLATLTDQPLSAHAQSDRALNFIGCGTSHAIASWGGLSAEGTWAWRWKNKIDRDFMARYRRT